MVRKLLLIFLVLSFSSKVALASPPPLVVQEEDGSPKKTYPTAIKFPNGNVTVNADGTVSIADNTSVGGGNSVYFEHDGSAVGNNASSDITLDGTSGIDLTCTGQDCTIKGEDASDTNKGIVELATTAETATGTDATRAVTPDGLHDMTTLAGAAWFLDEDDFVSDSATKTISQQSAKAYIASYAQPLNSNLTSFATVTPSANGLSLVSAANYAAMRTLLDLEAGTDFLAYSAFSANGITLVGQTFAQMQASLSVDDLVTLSGVADGAANLGTFTGTTISDNGTIKAALQELETAVEAGGGGGASTALDNLASVAINTSLISDTDNTDDLGSATKEWKDGYFDGTVFADAIDLNGTDIGSVFQPLEATLTDIADGTIAENLVNTANPWADNEVADDITASNYLPLAGGTMTGNITLAENASIALDPAGSADGKYTGITVTATAGYTQAFGDLVYLDPTDSRWEAVDANSAAAADGDARGILGMVVSAGTDGNACTILLQGIIRADAKFPTFTINNPIYASETAGSVTQTQPTTTDVVIRVVGFALTADEMYFSPSSSYITHT